MQTIRHTDDEWADQLQNPPRHHSQGALAGHVAAGFVLAAAVMVLPIVIVRMFL